MTAPALPPLPPAAALVLQGLAKRFDSSAPSTAPVLAPLDLTVPRGQFVSIIGPSGCGKSTLLRLVSGLSQPSSGQITLPDVARLAYVFQDPTLLPWLRVSANVEVPLRLRGDSAAACRAAAARTLTLLGLEPALHDRYPRQLSGGQKMRVSLARALALDPALLLLDEPFGALDELTRQHLNEELLGIRARLGFTTLFVTHSVSEAVFLSDRILVLAPTPGRIHADITLPFSSVRDIALRRSPTFHRLIDQVTSALHAASTATPLAA